MKKILPMMMAAVLVLSGTVPVFADQGTSAELEKAILKAKSVIDLPKDLTVFNSRSYDAKIEGQSVTCYGLEWENETGTKAVSASVDNLGNFLEYRSYEAAEQAGLAKVTREQAKKSAEVFLAKAVPQVEAGMKEVAADVNATDLSQHKFTYQYFLNDVPVSFMKAEIGVDRYTGTVTLFYGFDPGFIMPSLPAVSGVISKEQADQAWLSELGLSLNYYSYYDAKQKTLQVYLAYAVNERGMYGIDAKTGKSVLLQSGGVAYGRSNKESAVAEDAGTGGGSAGLSEEEIARINETAKLLSKEEAEQIIRGEFSLLKSSDVVDSARLTRSIVGGAQYQWQLSFENSSATVDASNGTILSFYYYGEQKNTGSISEQKAATIADEFLQRVAPAYIKETKLEKSSVLQQPRTGESSYNYRYNRIVNDCKFMDNYLLVNVDSTTGQILSYQNHWYPSVEFPAVTGVMNPVEAYQVLDRAKVLQLTYDKTEKGTISLVYEFQYSTGNVRIDPKRGVFLGYNGKEITENKLPSYTDIKGHWSEAYVTSLLENGYYLPGTEFKPNEEITQLDFLRYLYSTEWYNNDTDEFYERMEQRNIIKKGEKNPNSILSRQEAAKFIVRNLSLQQAGEHPELFVNVFKDTVQWEYQGYATLCSGLGILKGDESGRFNGTSTMTRAEAAVAIYQKNLLK